KMNLKEITVVATRGQKLTLVQDSTRKIILATRGEETREINNSFEEIETWGELSKILIACGFDLKNFQATLQTKVTWDNDEILIPRENFVLYLRPKATKSGADYIKGDRRCMMSYIKNDEKIKLYIKENYCQGIATNYTQLTTNALSTALEEYSNQLKSSTTTTVKTPVKKSKTLVTKPLTEKTKSISSLEEILNDIITSVSYAKSLIGANKVGLCNCCHFEPRVVKTKEEIALFIKDMERGIKK
ncbi:MAG: hypothetical protein ACRC0V_11705, partial [Fusobacteriaceae bacterium]